MNAALVLKQSYGDLLQQFCSHAFTVRSKELDGLHD